MSSYETIKLERQGDLTVLTMNRPDRFNAINTQMYNEIGDALNAEAENDDTSMLVITGAGKYYSSGNDLTTFADFLGGGKSPSDMAEMAYGIMIPYVDAFIDFPKPLAAVVNGPAIGIGVSTLGLFDFVYAHESATFVTPFTALGQSAEGCSSYTFPKIMGPSAASKLLLFNQKITAEEAKSYGIVGELFTDTDLPMVWMELEKYAALPKKSLKYSKQLIRTEADIEFLKQVNRAEGQRLKERWASEDCFEALANFMKRSRK